jgi:glycosyltransferase involved in cell wall biosynthesis
MVALRMQLTPRRPPFIVWVQDIYTLGLTETGEGGGIAGTIIEKVEGHTVRVASQVVVIHQRFADYIVEKFGVDPSKVTVVRNWTHLSESEPVAAGTAKSVLGWPSDVTLAVHTGNMGVKQGLENIVDAARIADQSGAPVHFILVGDGGERRQLVASAADISRLTFIDPLDDKNYRLALAAADILLVNEKPGVAAMAVPSKLTSYFHAGRPVVAATDAEGITASELTASGAGIHVPAGEPGALLAGVLDLATDPAAMARYGANGRRYRAAVLDERVALDRWATLVQTVIADEQSRDTAR